MKYIIVFTLALIMGNQDCGTPDPLEIREEQTEILDVLTIPDTIAIGDTITFRAIIKDSLDSRFKFKWIINENDRVPVNGRIDSSVIKWSSTRFINEAKSGYEVIELTVIADNGNEELAQPIKRFQFTINYN